MRPVISWHLCRSAKLIRLIVLLSLAIMPVVVASGCSDDRAAQDSAQIPAADAPPNHLKQVGPANIPGDRSAEPGATKTQAPAIPRKFIYDARIDLVVDSLNGLAASLMDLVKRHGGFLAESDLASQVSTQRTATWRVRVPVDRFDDFVRGVSKLGEVRTSHLGSQDVTEEYFDLEARIRNKQEEEKRLLKHLTDSTGKLEDILKVESELSRVRGEVEQMQGRLRFLANRADLSTVTITATELKDYRPPEPVTLAAQVHTTFFRSLNALIAFGASLLLVVVALVPWLPVLIVGAFVLYAIYRASLKAEARMTTRPAPAGPAGSWPAADEKPGS
jgi:hypothetical protein